jgi:mediator of RNA polymerase II transcription subunit 14
VKAPLRLLLITDTRFLLVAQMSKKKQWRDVRLLSFDLQTVEFVYAQDYTVSISCQDQLSLTGGNFDLEFGRKLPEDVMDTDESVDVFNPHEDAEPFLRDILRHAHGGLAPSLHELVTALRNTLPIVVELEIIRKEGALNRRKLQIFVKDANWYRLLYGDLKHALDFRLMSEQRVVIMDASHSLFNLQTPGNVPASDPILDDLILQPIPGMREIVKAAVKDEQVVAHTKSGKVTAIDIGVICNAAAVGPLTKIIHAQVLERLKS